MTDTRTDRDRAGRPRRWVATGAAAAAVALVAGGTVLLATGRHPAPSSPGGPAPRTTAPAPRASDAPTTAMPADRDPASLVVRDGAQVEATGQVIAAPGRPVVFCPGLPQDAIGYLPGHEPAPSCPPWFAVTVVGVHLDQLAQPRTVRGVRVGGATLRGTWHDRGRDRTITVREQAAPSARPDPMGPPEHPPCPAPAGGWRPGTVDAQPAQVYVQQHPDRFGQLWIGWPDGYPSGPTDAPGYAGRTQVVVVSVAAADLAAARRDLAAVYRGNLCVVPSRYSAAEAGRAQSAVGRLMDDHRNGIYTVGLGGDDRHPVDVSLLVLDQRLYQELSRLGLQLLRLDPAVTPR